MTGAATSPGFDGVTIPRVDFLIVGAMKCATTTVKEGLRTHPDVHMPERETHFFGNHRRYLSVWRDGRIDPAEFARAYGDRFRTDRRLVGDKTPNYAISTMTLERIQRFHPGARIVMMVRDPVERARSHWDHMRRQVAAGRLPALRVCGTLGEQILRDTLELETLRHPASEASGANLLWRGFYDVQVRRIRRFFPPDRVFVGVVDDLRDDAARFWGGLQEFLGLPRRPVTLPPASAERERRHRLSEIERAALRAVYSESVRELERLIGRELPSWRS